MPKINRYWNSDPDSLVERKPPQTYELCKVCEIVRILELRESYQKYKRCLAMAMWCEATALWCFQAANTLPVGLHATLYGKPVMIEPNRLFKRYALLTKWSARWSKLAKEFKREYDNGRR